MASVCHPCLDPVLSLQATCVEILALHRRPRLFLIDLEKKLNVIKEALCKKQVEIKEVNLKKKTTCASGGKLYDALNFNAVLIYIF